EKILKKDIREVPFEDGIFDFVCCNGVVHHTENPEEIIKELSRVLKNGGYLFLYVYDTITHDWEVIDEIRKINKVVPVERFHAFLKHQLNLPENKLFNFCDLIYAPIQLRFTKSELNGLLKEFDVRYLSVPFTDYDRPEECRLIAKKTK
ncbi:MAG: class I SAM-dependent methyltransferase, partial [Candidatus Altiarchaeales archaeon]|nr:class I SAM-dependent methyltransferase [Candidatus Altiarchaeales archaeon]